MPDYETGEPLQSLEMSSHREIELKFVVGREHLGTLKRHPLLQGKPAEQLKLDAVYYDTPKDKLARSGMSLRVRQEGNTRLQTVKAEADGGLVDRGEWEAPTSAQTLDLEALRRTPVGKLLNGTGRKLIPKVETHVHRSRWNLEIDGAEIELVVDEGQVLAGRASKDLSEVELELKDGPKDALFRVAKSLTSDVPLRLGVESKYQQGQALLRNNHGEVHRAERIHLRRDATAADALRVIVHSCLRHFRLNEPLLLEARNPAALHQCRVALRRVRSALSLFKDIIRDERSQAIRRSLEDVAAEFGTARNLDVFLEAHEQGTEVDTADLTRMAREERVRAYDRLVARLNGAEFRSFVVDLVAWLETGEWRDGQSAGTPLRSYCRRKLRKRHGSLSKNFRGLENLTEDQRHRIRIKAKKLRYACEFFASLSEHPKRLERYLAGVAGVQEALGELNDAVTTRRLAIDLVRSDAPDSATSFAGAIVASRSHANEAQLEAAEHAMSCFARLKTFW
jgi:inorganic triphosphatase YgiF